MLGVQALGIFLGFQITVDLTLALFIFYMDVVLLRYDYYELVVGVLLVSTVAFIPLMNLLAQRRGKVFPLFVGVPLWILASLAFLTVDPQTPVAVLCVLAVVIAVGSAAGNLATWSMLSDIYDIDELLTAQRREGLYSGVTTFLRKFASGVAVLLVLLTVCLAFALRNKVDQRRFDAVLAGIDELRTSGTVDGLSAQQLDDVLVVTGATRDQLWGAGGGGTHRRGRTGGAPAR